MITKEEVIKLANLARLDFSDDELIAIIANNNEDTNYRRGFLEVYLSKHH